MHYPRVRDMLLRLRWGGRGLTLCTIYAEDRTEPNQLKAVDGATITRIGRREFETDTATIPFYKVQLIENDGEVIWRRPEKCQGEGSQ